MRFSVAALTCISLLVSVSTAALADQAVANTGQFEYSISRVDVVPRPGSNKKEALQATV